MKVSVEHLGDVKFAVSARGHRVICDQPVENGGDDKGMSPPELLLASLGTCAAYYAAEYLKVRKLPTGDLQVRVSAKKETQPARLASFDIEVTAPDVADRHKDGILRAVKACLIHNTLLGGPNIQVSVNAKVHA